MYLHIYIIEHEIEDKKKKKKRRKNMTTMITKRRRNRQISRQTRNKDCLLYINLRITRRGNDR